MCVMKNVLLICFFLSSILVVKAQQTYEPIYNYRMIEPADYVAYEPEMKKALDWFLFQSTGMDADKRTDVSIFFMKWIEGTPNVNVILNDNVITFKDSSPLLIVQFMMGWSLYSLNNNFPDDLLQCNRAAIEAVVKYYRDNRSFHPNDKNIEKYEKMIKEGKLEDYLKKQLKKKEKKKKEKKKEPQFDPKKF